MGGESVPRLTGESVALPPWEFAPDPLHQQSIPCLISTDGEFLFFLNYPLTAIPAALHSRLCSLLLPPHHQFKFKNSPVFSSI